jgi:hypothetical protein
METYGTLGPGNLPKAGPGTRRYKFRFRLSTGKSVQRAWRASTQDQAWVLVQQHYYRTEGATCTIDEAEEIEGSYKP